MWQRFTQGARRLIFFAQEEAHRLDDRNVSPEHLLLGLARENDGIAVRVLEKMGVSLRCVRSEIERQLARGEGPLDQEMQLAPRAMRVIDLAYDEARQLGNDYIGSEHLLLGLIREGEGVSGRVLANLGMEWEQAHHILWELQAGNQLLRPVGTAETPAAEMLRPAAGTTAPEIAPDELLRSSTPKNRNGR